MIGIADISSTVVVAWWGAVIATVVLFWDIYKWKRSGPKIRLDVWGNMSIMGDPEKAGKTWITIEAANIGDRATTLDKVTAVFHKNKWSLLLRKPSQSFWLKSPGINLPLPHKLEPGATWQGLALQDDKLTSMANRGYLYLCLHHSSHKKPVIKRVNISKAK